MTKTLSQAQRNTMYRINMYGRSGGWCGATRTITILISRFGFVTTVAPLDQHGSHGLWLTEAGRAWIATHPESTSQ